MRRMSQTIGLIALITLTALALVGATPRQSGVPPLPYNADIFSGAIYLDGAPAPEGLQMVACVSTCDEFQTQTVLTGPGGSYSVLAIHPENRSLRGAQITFHIVNQHGRIQAQEHVYFEGGFNSEVLDLNFTGPLPAPAPPRSRQPFPPSATPSSPCSPNWSWAAASSPSSAALPCGSSAPAGSPKKGGPGRPA